MLQTALIFFIIFFPLSALAEDTQLKLFRPFGGEITLITKKTVSGNCLVQSKRSKREDAWRCEAEGVIYDPCFVKQYGSQREAICPISPWLTESTQINLSAPVDNSQHLLLDMGDAYPWAMELTTGEKCLAVDEGEAIDGLLVHYKCNTQTVLIGHVQRCDAKWKILQRTNNGISTATIQKAWF